MLSRFSRYKIPVLILTALLLIAVVYLAFGSDSPFRLGSESSPRTPSDTTATVSTDHTTDTDETAAGGEATVAIETTVANEVTIAVETTAWSTDGASESSAFTTETSSESETLAETKDTPCPPETSDTGAVDEAPITTEETVPEPPCSSPETPPPETTPPETTPSETTPPETIPSETTPPETTPPETTPPETTPPETTPPETTPPETTPPETTPPETTPPETTPPETTPPETASPSEKPIRLYLDQGHNPLGHTDSGILTDTCYEGDITFAVGIALAERLSADPRFEVLLSRPDADTVLGNSVPASLLARVDEANQWGADYFISLHGSVDKADSAKRGVETLYYGRSAEEKTLATLLGETVAKEIGFPNRGALQDKNHSLLKQTVMPAVIVNMGYLTNETDADFLAANPTLVADALYCGLLSCFSLL